MELPLIQHNYQSIEGWFNMEKQYLELLYAVPEGGVFVELGSYKGKSTSFVGTEVLNSHRNIKIVAVDSFSGLTELSNDMEVSEYGKVDLTDLHNEYLKNTNHVRSVVKTIVSLSHVAANQFKDESVDAIFIDAGHSYDAVTRDITAWFPKMKKGGIMAGHDYDSWPGVKTAVDEFFGKPHKVENNCWFIYLND